MQSLRTGSVHVPIVFPTGCTCNYAWVIVGQWWYPQRLTNILVISRIK